MARLGNVFNNKEDIKKEELHPRRTIKWIHYYPIKKKPAEKDHIITLSTCSGKQKGDSYRFVVHSLVTDTVIYEE